MAGNAEGALKAAATRTGLGVNEYIDRLNAGLLYCWRCQDWHEAEEFGKDRSRASGRAASCRRSVAAARIRKHPERPGKRERDTRKAQGQAWCRGCADWLPIDQVRSGVCRMHAAAEYRRLYAANPGPIRQRVYARKRELEPIPSWWREERFEFFGGLCAYGCERDATDLDHVRPVALGGTSDPRNLVPACSPCNNRKRASDPLPWIERFASAFPVQFCDFIALDLESPTPLNLLEMAS